MYLDSVAKKGDTSSPPSTPSFRVFITPARSEPYDLKVHNRGCKTMLPVFSGFAGLGLLGTETWTGFADSPVDRTAGSLDRSRQCGARVAENAMIDDGEKRENLSECDEWILMVQCYVECEGMYCNCRRVRLVVMARWLSGPWWEHVSIALLCYVTWR